MCSLSMICFRVAANGLVLTDIDIHFIVFLSKKLDLTTSIVYHKGR